MRDAELIKVFNRRALLIAGGELFLFSILAGRLYQLQILDNAKYKNIKSELCAVKEILYKSEKQNRDKVK